MRRSLLAIILPLLLAAGILAAGTMVPGRLLRQRQTEFIREASTVPVGDVHPYGDDYETMKQSLLQTIGLFQKLDGAEGDRIVDREWDDTVDTVQGQLELFWETLWGGLSGKGYPISIPYLDYYGGATAVMDQEELDNWMLAGQSSDWSEMINVEYVCSPYQGIPIVLNLYLNEYYDAIDPAALWESLTAAYQERCGLIFTDPVTTSSADTAADVTAQTELSDAETLVKGEFAGWVYSSEYVECSYSAASTDFTFRLTMDVSVYAGSQCTVLIRLNENI